MRPFIVLGDRTDHGGVVIGSTQTTDTFGQRLARVGDQVTCPKKGHGTTVIVTGDPTMIVDGAPVARHGDKCACGATLIFSQVVSGVSEGPGSQFSATVRASVNPLAPRPIATAAKPLGFDDRFRLIDQETQSPLPHTAYAIRRASGSIEHGITDHHGDTHLLSAQAEAEHIDIYV